MYFDTSRVGLGCAFMQNGNVIAYSSKHIKIQKRNYPTHDLELVVVMFALKIFCHYIYDVYVDVFNNLKIKDVVGVTQGL